MERTKLLLNGACGLWSCIVSQRKTCSPLMPLSTHAREWIMENICPKGNQQNAGEWGGVVEEHPIQGEVTTLPFLLLNAAES